MRFASKRSTIDFEVLLEHVVAEVHDEVVVAEEVARDEHAVREPERLVLADVGDLDAEREPSPSAASISAAASSTPMTTPMSLIPAAAICSTT